MKFRIDLYWCDLALARQTADRKAAIIKGTSDEGCEINAVE